jgi:hypothetical protein
MMRLDPTVQAWYLAALGEPDCPACATGWHSRCCHPELDEDGDEELVERCCDACSSAVVAVPFGLGGVLR